LAFNPALDMGRIVGNKADAAHRRAALGGKASTFDVKVLDQRNGIACVQRHTVCVFMGGGGGDVIGPDLRFLIKIQLIEQIAGPRRAELGQRAGGKDLDGRVFGPHRRGQTAEMITLWGVERVCTGGADKGGGIRRSTGDGLG
jgi:hypothetical protein